MPCDHSHSPVSRSDLTAPYHGRGQTQKYVGVLQTTALHDILELLGALSPLVADEPPDDAKLHLTLSSLVVRFEQLTSRAQSFMRGLQRTVDLRHLSRGLPRVQGKTGRLPGTLHWRTGRLSRSAEGQNAETTTASDTVVPRPSGSDAEGTSRCT
jgi:Protein of unknown function (DUF2397)